MFRPPILDERQSRVLQPTYFAPQSTAGFALSLPIPAPSVRHSCGLHFPASRANRFGFASIAFGRRTGFDTLRVNPTGFSYNFGRHGFLRLLPTWPWLEQDTMPFFLGLFRFSVANLAL